MVQTLLFHKLKSMSRRNWCTSSCDGSHVTLSIEQDKTKLQIVTVGMCDLSLALEILNMCGDAQV